MKTMRRKKERKKEREIMREKESEREREIMRERDNGREREREMKEGENQGGDAKRGR